MQELVYRFIVGGIVVSLFAVTGDVLKPNSFAGLFGAAPSVALATLSLTVLANGKSYSALESRSMIAGSFAFFVYACLCARLIKKHHLNAAPATMSGIAVWFACAVGAWLLVLR